MFVCLFVCLFVYSYNERSIHLASFSIFLNYPLNFGLSSLFHISSHFVSHSIIATESSILREEGKNITCDGSTHSMSFTCPPLVHGNVSWCPANPIPGIHYLQVNLG